MEFSQKISALDQGDSSVFFIRSGANQKRGSNRGETGKKVLCTG